MNLPLFDTAQIKQWHCYLVDLNPPRKSKPGKIRPALVLQASDSLQLQMAGVMVAPLTTKLRAELFYRPRIYPRPGLQLLHSSEIIVDEIQTVDRSFFIKDLGKLVQSEIDQVSQVLRFHFGW